MKVLYIVYIDLKTEQSGSEVRPVKMYNAFIKAGMDVKLLSGDQGLKNIKSRIIRKRKVNEIIEWLKSERPDFCYIEPTTGPIVNRSDIKLIEILHKLEIPTAYFFRDCYYKFKELFPLKGPLRNIKSIILDCLWRRTEKTLKKVDIIYFPAVTSTIKQIFSYKNMISLPPAAENKYLENKKLTNTCIYVGGISESYGIHMLLESFQLLNSGSKQYSLILVCRKEEYVKLDSPLKSANWLEVVHTSGKELEKYYQKASIALIPRQNNVYSHMSISIKLFEYIGFGLPIVMVNSEEMAKIVKKYNIGMVTSFSPLEFSEAIKSMLSNQNEYNIYRENLKGALYENLWISRIEKIKKDLLETRIKNET